MYSTQSFLRGYEKAISSSSGNSNPKGDEPTAGARRIKLLNALKAAPNCASTAFELSVRVGDRPETVFADLHVMSQLELVTVDGTSEDAVVRLTDAGHQYVELVG